MFLKVVVALLAAQLLAGAGGRGLSDGADSAHSSGERRGERPRLARRRAGELPGPALELAAVRRSSEELGGRSPARALQHVLHSPPSPAPAPAPAPPRRARLLPPPKERKPNIVLILTDDQDVELGSLNFMPRTMRLVRDAGAEFRHAYTTTPMCCPSRSSLLTGMYVHNHNVFTNNDNCSGPAWQADHEPRSFAAYLSNAGYRTGYFGKYLNKYNGSYIPPGWREWGGLIMNSKYYNYSINMNGKKIKHGFDYHKDYYPDLIANDSLAFLRHSKQRSARKPVLLVLSFPAPHGPEDAAPHFTHLFFNVTTHHTPTYDHAPNPDKQWILQVTNKMQPIHRKFTDLLMTKRLQTLQSVDQAVERVCQELKQLGELDNTYVVYTSDHGYHLGQFGLVKGKSFPFEFDVRVPFLVRGPGVEPGAVVDDIVLNIDMAPTFLHMAGVPTPAHMDGRSFLPLLAPRARRPRPRTDTFLIESSGRRESPEQLAEARARAAALRYSPPADSAEDEPSDGEAGLEPDDEAANDVPADPPDEQPDNALPRVARLARACAAPALRRPCARAQRWRCVLVAGRWRRHKCKYETEVKASSKKCACFTPGGVVYTRLETDGAAVARRRRTPALDAVLARLDSAVHLPPPGDAVAALRGLDARIAEARASLASYESRARGERAKRSLKSTTFGLSDLPGHSGVDLECKMERNGAVNCSEAVYRDLKTWHANRLSIEDQIRKLKGKLDDLKEIRRHLKESKPDGANSPEDVSTGSEDEPSATESAGAGSNELLQQSSSGPATETTESSSRHHHSRGDRRRPDVEPEAEKAFLNESNFESDNLDSSLRNATGPNLDGGDYVDESESLGNHSLHEDSGPTLSSHRYSMTIDLITEVPTTSGPSTPAQPAPGDGLGPARIDIASLRGGGTRPESPEPPARLPPFYIANEDQHTCYCEQDKPRGRGWSRAEELAREERRRLKEERVRKRQRKARRKAKLVKECLSERMNCFSHDDDHWRTEPRWTLGPFCFCMNANNNTYSCLRTINSTHNFLYCQFVTGLITFYNLRIDPFETQNRARYLTGAERSFLADQLEQLKGCRGRSCSAGADSREPEPRAPAALRLATEEQRGPHRGSTRSWRKRKIWEVGRHELEGQKHRHQLLARR